MAAQLHQLKLKVYDLIREDDKNDLYANLFDGFIVALIIINLVVVFADTFEEARQYRTLFSIVETVSVVIFTIEYLARVWTADLKYKRRKYLHPRVKYIFSFMAVIDLVAILPFYLPQVFALDLRALRSLRMLRLLRIFKFNRYTSAMTTIGEVFRKRKSQLASSIFMILLLMIIASVMMYSVENQAQPEVFDNALSAMWYAIVTLTTVGYGDLYPVTVLGKVLSAVIALLGIALVAIPTGIISAGFMEQTEAGRRKDKKAYCPYCGHKLDE
ncbi:MAG: ion transporter [Erysipelotrichaceae bacterium]|jgi:voltage-gated potassium channel|nr:ion transporter [Erysipelotrichaceae bacterium]